MNSKPSLKETLQEIDSTQKFDKLEAFKHPNQWKKLKPDDMSLLANLFIKKGSMELQNSRDQAIESFETAARITDKSAPILLQISRAWASVQEWDHALQNIESALKSDDSFLEGWMEKAALFVLKGKNLNEESYFSEALEIFERIKNERENLPPEFYFKWGQAIHCLARFSQEPCDLTLAIEKYRLAESEEFSNKHLFFDLALALGELATLVARTELVHESLHYLLLSVEADPHFHDGWIYLAITYQFLYEQGDKDEYYERAESAFYTASKLNPSSKTVWLSWGQMLLNEGRIKRNHEIVSLAIEKFDRAAAFFPKDRDIECFLADAMMVLGLFEDRYDLLQEAKSKIEASLQENPEDAAALFLYGTCLVHLGKYFDDKNLIRSSFEKFEKSLKLSPEDPHVWHSLALAHYSYGEMTEDPIMLEKSIQLFDMALKKLNRPDSELFNNWGIALMKLSDVTGDLLNVQVAADKFEQAIAYHQDTRNGRDPDPEWYYNYGCALDYLGDFYQDPAFYEKSAQVLTQLVNTFPGYSQARYNLALSLTHFGDALGEVEFLEKGISHFEVLLAEDPEDEIVITDMGVALIALGEVTETSESIFEAKEIYASAESKLIQASILGSKGAFFWLACLYALTRSVPESIHYLEKARDIDALPVREQLLEEKWLENVRGSEAWQNFYKSLPHD